MVMSQRLGKKDAIMTLHASIPDGIYLIATSVSPDTRCPAGQGLNGVKIPAVAVPLVLTKKLTMGHNAVFAGPIH